LSASQHHDWVFLLLMEMRQKLRTQTVYDGYKTLPEIFGSILYSCVYTHCQQLMQSVTASYGSSSLLFVMKVMGPILCKQPS
jgi:hypothetical protein